MPEATIIFPTFSHIYFKERNDMKNITTNKIKFPISQDNLVFNFMPIFECWLLGRCTTDYLIAYCNRAISSNFTQELERIKNAKENK